MATPFSKLEALFYDKSRKVEDAANILDEYERKSKQGGIFQPLMYVYFGIYKWLKFYPIYQKTYDEWQPISEALSEAMDILLSRTQETIKAEKDVLRVCQIVENFKDKMLI